MRPRCKRIIFYYWTSYFLFSFVPTIETCVAEPGNAIEDFCADLDLIRLSWQSEGKMEAWICETKLYMLVSEYGAVKLTWRVTVRFALLLFVTKITFEVSFQAKQGWYAHVKQTLRLNCRIHWKQIVKQNTLCQLLWFMYFTQYLITGFGLLLRQSNEHRSTSCSSRVVVFQAGPVSSLLFSVT